MATVEQFFSNPEAYKFLHKIAERNESYPTLQKMMQDPDK